MPKTPSKMHMYDMVKIDTIDFEIVGGGVCFQSPLPSRIISCLKYPGMYNSYEPADLTVHPPQKNDRGWV